MVSVVSIFAWLIFSSSPGSAAFGYLVALLLEINLQAFISLG